MKLFLVYKPILTDEMYRSINKCSNDTDWKNAYFRSGLMNDRNAQEIVDECARTALYRLVAVAYVDELEQVFDIGNGYPVKPEPVKQVHWCNDYEDGPQFHHAWWHKSRESADSKSGPARIAVIRREIVDGVVSYYKEDV